MGTDTTDICQLNNKKKQLKREHIWPAVRSEKNTSLYWYSPLAVKTTFKIILKQSQYQFIFHHYS